MTDKISEIDLKFQEQAWNYFSLHASQRLTTFNFYLVVLTIALATIAASFQKDFTLPFIRHITLIFLTLVSILFLKLDRRNKELIKHSESVLEFFENKYISRSSSDFKMAIFTNERENREIYKTTWSYSNVFEVFIKTIVFMCIIALIIIIINP